MSRDLVHVNPVTGTREYWCEDGEGGWALYAETPDVSPTLELAAAIGELQPGDGLRHVAEVPLIFMDQALREGWFHDRAEWRKRLNDGAWARFRSWGGRL